jgi:FkbM family methyltransferase
MATVQANGRALVKKLLAIPTISIPLTRGLFRLPLSDSLRRKIRILPVCGTFFRPLPNGRGHLQLWSDGYDQVMTMSFWTGVGSYEPEVMRVMPGLLVGVRTFVDVGASSGIYGLLAAAENPDRKVYCLEPSPQTFARLRRNSDANHFNNLTILQKALTSRGGPITLYLTDFQLDSSTIPDHRAHAVPIQVESMTLDDFTEANEINQLDLIKMDVEGAEPGVLAGGAATIARDRPIIVCEVLFGTTERALEEFLEPFAYSYFLITDTGLEARDNIEGDATSRYLNYLFVPQSRASEIADRTENTPGWQQ